MTEYIEREALIEWLKRILLIDLSDGRGLCRVIMEDDFKKAIKKMPKGIIADVAPVKHGRWIEYTKVIIPEPYNKWEQAWKCSECGFDDGFVAYNFCPNCGAKMDIPDTEEDDNGDQAN